MCFYIANIINKIAKYGDITYAKFRLYKKVVSKMKLALKFSLISITILIGLYFYWPTIAHATTQNPDEIKHALTDNHIFGKVEYLFMLRLVLAFILGCIAGITHSLSKSATVTISLKTYGAVALGSAMFSCIYTHLFFNTLAPNPLQNLGSITTGIGFFF